ncbi:TniQ family protein [Photobacterium sagamiensis]
MGNVNGYKQSKPFLSALKRYLCNIDELRFESLPTDLTVFNPCYSRQNSASRTHAIRALSHLVFKEPVELQQLTLNRANAKFSPSTTALIRQAELFPRSLLRKTNVPICPKCLAENGYARYWWHFLPYSSCHIHNSELLTQCMCGHEIDYRHDGLFPHCPKCKVSYLEQQQSTSADVLELSFWLSGAQSSLYPDVSRSHRWGIAHWWYTQHDLKINVSEFNTFWSNWPQSLDEELDQQIQNAIEFRVKDLNELTCREVMGAILFNTVLLPNRNFHNNIIFKHVVRYLDEHMLDNNGFIANLRINSIEASLLLATSLDQVASLVEQGLLKPNVRLKSNSTLSIKSYVFYLGDIFCLWLSDFQSETYNRSVYVSRW